jgi:hypothetical protein
LSRTCRASPARWRSRSTTACSTRPSAAERPRAWRRRNFAWRSMLELIDASVVPRLRTNDALLAETPAATLLLSNSWSRSGRHRRGWIFSYQVRSPSRATARGPARDTQ